jgi:hypothetical protein
VAAFVFCFQVRLTHSLGFVPRAPRRGFVCAVGWHVAILVKRADRQNNGFVYYTTRILSVIWRRAAPLHPLLAFIPTRSNASDSRYRMADTAVLDAEAKKRKRDSTPEHLRVQPVDPEEKLLRSDEPRIRHREAASSAWTLQLPRPLVSLLRDLCERRPVEHFITVRAVAHGRSINLSGRWTVETSHGSSHVLPRWMQEPELLRPEQDGELMVTMHTHPRAAITQSLDTVPSLRRRQQLARTNPLLYVPSLADVNNMLRYGMHASTVRRRPGQSPSSAAASPRRRAWRLWAARHSQGERSDHWRLPATASGARASRLQGRRLRRP